MICINTKSILPKNPVSSLVIIFALLIFGLTYFSLVKTSNHDPETALLVAQSIIEHGTIKLDPYKDVVQYKHGGLGGNYRVEFKAGHFFYRYPIGTSVFSIPFVFVANLMGQDMAVAAHDHALQSFIAALLCAFIFVIIYKICICYVSSIASLVIAIISMMGSAMISTMGTGLWNLNFMVLFNLLTLLHLARYDTTQIKRLNPYWLGFLLFAAFFCRPTSAYLVAAVFIYLFWQNRNIALKMIASFLMLFVCFMLLTWFEYGALLPDYYLPKDHILDETSWTLALYGNLLSPARGLFIYSPFFLLVLIGVIYFFASLKQYPLFWLTIIWFWFHLVVISNNTVWWGGNSYGPRLLIDSMLALILLTALLWREISARANLKLKKLVLAGYVTFGLVGIFINSYQGLYNIYTIRWDEDLKRNLDFLFDWEHPQFLATAASLRHRSLELKQKHLDFYGMGDILNFATAKAVFWDWSEPNLGWRWTEGKSSQIVVKLDGIEPHKEYTLEILAASLATQNVNVTLNDTLIGQLNLEKFSDAKPPQAKVLTFSGLILKEKNLNQIDFSKDTKSAKNLDMVFVHLRIYPNADPSTLQHNEVELK